MSDGFLSGRLEIEQADFRAGHDSVLLGVFARKVCDRGIMLDVGCGAGTPLLVYGWRHARVKLWGVEANAKAANLARHNLLANGFADRSCVIQGDIFHNLGGISRSSADGVMLNPPYWQEGGAGVENEGKRAAKFSKRDIASYVQVSCTLLKVGGWLSVVLPSSRSVFLLEAMQSRLCRLTILPVHSKAQSPARLLLVSGKKLDKPNGGDITLLRGLVMHNEDGSPSFDAKSVTQNGSLPEDIAALVAGH